MIRKLPKRRRFGVHNRSQIDYSSKKFMSNKPSVDGFIPRRTSGQAGGARPEFGASLPRPVPRVQNRPAVQADARPTSLEPRPARPETSGLKRSDVDDSLRQIDDTSKQEEQRHQRGGFHSQRKRLIKRVMIALFIVFLLIGVWIGIRALLASTSIFKGDIFGLVQQKKLKEDASGRTNILVFGTSEDDEGGDHPGAFLTDSIMVLSVNQTKKDAYMVSIPRDLWVKYGQACNSGYEGKINEVFGCYSDNGKDSQAGSKALAKIIGQVVGMDIQYQAHVNYTVVRQAVDAVDGITVKVESEDPRGILDRNFDWKCNYKCYYVKYSNGQVAEMDGEHALAFMRARNAQGGYGLPGGNFDREKNQQKVLVALREKALSAGTLANPTKVTGLIGALGDNLRTNFETSEIRTVMALASDIPTSSIVSVSLVDEKEPVMTTGRVGAQSVVHPFDGLYDYDGVAAYIKRAMTSDPATKEGASVVVLNGSGVPGAAQEAATKLEGMGYAITSVGNAPDGNYQRRELYQRDTTSMPLTRTKLTNLYGTPKTGLTQFGVAADVDFVVIVGKADVQAN